MTFRDGHLDLSAVRRRELSGTLVDNDKDEDEHSCECERDNIDIASETEEVAMRAFRNGWDAQGSRSRSAIAKAFSVQNQRATHHHRSGIKRERS